MVTSKPTNSDIIVERDYPNLINVSWDSFINDLNSPDIEILDLNLNPSVDSNQIVIRENLTDPAFSRLHISDASHILTVAELSDTKLMTTTSNNKFHNGLVVEQREDTWLLYQHITYDNKSKSVIIFDMRGGYHYPIWYTKCLPDEMVYGVKYNKNEPRDPNSKPNAKDFILCDQVSSKILKKCRSADTIGKMYLELYDLLMQTIDPGYIIKLFSLYYALAYNKS